MSYHIISYRTLLYRVTVLCPLQEEDSEGRRLHSSAVHHLNKAWEKYYVVFRNINRHLPQVRITAYY